MISKDPEIERRAFHLTGVTLEGLRGFNRLEIPFTTGDGRARLHTLVIGRNGTCKSTLLRAIALGLAHSFEASALLESPIGALVRSGEEEGRIALDLISADDERLTARNEITLRRKGGIERSGSFPGPPPFFVAYGAGRFFSGAEASSFSKYSAVDASAGLFNRTRPLADPELTLRRLQDFQGTKYYERTLAGIKKLLDLGPEDEIRFRKGGGLEIAGPVGPSIGLDGWADGYRVTFTWLLDFFGWAMQAGTIDEEGVVRGILLIDEVDQHLHPSMQAQVLPRLAELLPEVQVVATTHSPLVALGSRPDEMVALHRTPQGDVEVVPAPDFRLYSAEDMLTDERLFATSPYSEDVTLKTAHYQALAAIPPGERLPQERDDLRELARELSPPAPAEDPAVAALEEVKGILARHGIA